MSHTSLSSRCCDQVAGRCACVVATEPAQRCDDAAVIRTLTVIIGVLNFARIGRGV